MRLRPRSIRLRLSLWFTGAMAVILLVFAATIYGATRAGLSQQIQDGLRTDLEAVRSMLRHDPGELYELHEHGGVEHFAVATDGKFGYSAAPWLDRFLLGEAEPASVYHPDRGEEYIVRTDRVVESGIEYRIAVARSEEPIHRSLFTLAIVILVTYPFALGFAFGGGYFVTGRMLLPIDAMAAQAERISAERLAERLPVDNPVDELGRLATVFNEMLSRIEGAFLRLKRFTSDASHELRTPLTAIRSVGEVGLREGLEAQDYRDTISSILEEADRLTHLVESLLTLTRADAQNVSLEMKPVDVARLLDEVVDFLHVLAEGKRQSISVDCPDRIVCLADRQTLRVALVNILDNAIKYTPDEGSIRVVAAQSGDGSIHIEINDTGPGIPEQHIELVFERFFRVEQERGGLGGTGLGLAIARWAVEANGGAVTARRHARGASFEIVLPLAAPS